MTLGRPKKITPRVLQKLEDAFQIGATDEEACNSAKIAPQTLYNYQTATPDFVEQKARWKLNPILKAKKTVVDNLERDPHLAMRYLEKRCPDEFGRNARGFELTLAQERLDMLQSKMLEPAEEDKAEFA